MEEGFHDGYLHFDPGFWELLLNHIRLPCRPKLALTYLDTKTFPGSDDLKADLRSQDHPKMIKEVVEQLPESMREKFLEFYGTWFERAEYLRRQHAHALGLPITSDWETILVKYRERYGEPKEVPSIMCLKRNYESYAPLKGHLEDYGKPGDYEYRLATQEEFDRLILNK